MLKVCGACTLCTRTRTFCAFCACMTRQNSRHSPLLDRAQSRAIPGSCVIMPPLWAGDLIGVRFCLPGG